MSQEERSATEPDQGCGVMHEPKTEKTPSDNNRGIEVSDTKEASFTLPNIGERFDGSGGFAVGDPSDFPPPSCPVGQIRDSQGICRTPVPGPEAQPNNLLPN